MLRAYKYALLPTEDQKQQLAKFFGCVRFVYNLALECKMRAWTTHRRNLTCIDLCYQLKELKDTEAPWLKDCPAQALQMALRRLDNAYTNFFRGKRFPKFKSKRDNRQSVHFPQSVKVEFEKGIVTLPKLRSVKCVLHRKFEGEIKTVTVSKTAAGKYFVSILVDNQKELPKKKPIAEETAVGIDMGVKAFATLSNGTVFDNPKFLSESLKRLRVEQRKLSRRFRRGVSEQSKSYQKQKLLVANLHSRISNRREDFLQKTSTKIIRSYDTVCLEDLNIQGMIKNRSLALAISEVGWYKFKTMLEYKAESQGKNILCIGKFAPSSKLCSTCGNLFKELSLSDRNWTCKSCGTLHDRDANAAQNIKIFGLRNGPSTVNVSR